MGPKLGSCGRWWCWFRCVCEKSSRMNWRGRTRVWAPPNADPESLQGTHHTVFFDRDAPASGGSRSATLGKFWPVRRRFRQAASKENTYLAAEDGEVERDAAPGDVSSSSLGLSNGLRGRYTVFAARLSIMVMLTVLIGVLTILTWHFTTVYTTKSIESLAYNLRMDILERPVNRMRSVLNTTVSVTIAHTHLVAYVFSRHTNPGQMSEISTVMRNVTWAIFTSQPMVSTLHVVYKNGICQGYERGALSTLQYYSYTLPLNETAEEIAASPALSPVGDPANSSEDFVSYAASSEFSWYKQVVEDVDSHPQVVGLPFQHDAEFNLSVDFNGFDHLDPGDIAWHATVHQSSPVPFLAAGSTVRDSTTGEVLAITGTTQELSSVNDLMEQLTALHSGTMYLISVNGLLLASSTSAPLVRNTTDGPALLMAIDCADPIIKSSTKWLRNAYGMNLQNLQNLQNVHRENIVLLGDKYYIDTFALNLTRLPLIGVIVTPRSAVLGEVDRRGHATLAILISVSACFLLVGCFCTFVFTNGVSNEMKLRVELIDHLRARRRAEASSTYKSQFLANMSHELRTPMAAVIGLLDIMLSDESMTSEQVAMMSQIRQCATALLRLLNNILDLSKVESGKLVLDNADFDLRHELEGLVDMFSVQCPDQHIEIVLDLADDVPRTLVGDSGRIVQVFANLIANSIKFTSTGHVVVRGRCEPPPFSGACGRSGLLYPKNERISRSGIVDYSNPRLSTQSIAETTEDGLNLTSDKICIWFEIDDTGIGIDPRKWETVFGSFVQADASTTRTHGGTGLGLCIVRSLVQQMGGEIKVAKKDGPGTLLRFFLLLKPSQEPSPPKTFDDFIVASLPWDTLRNSKVVFALQGKTGRTLITKWMIRRDLRVRAAANWEETLTELEDLLQEDDEFPNSHRLAILDIGLLPSTGDLDELDTYVQKGVRIAWLLNHDTTSILKSDLRKRGFSIMANKPVYKSKIIHLLRMLMGFDKDVDISSFRESGALKPDLVPSRSSFQYDVEQHFVDVQLATSKQQISEQACQEESPSTPESVAFRNSIPDPFPIFKPNNYIQSDAIGLNKANKPRNSVIKIDHEETVSEGGSFQLSFPEETQVSQERGSSQDASVESLQPDSPNFSIGEVTTRQTGLPSQISIIIPSREEVRVRDDLGPKAEAREGTFNHNGTDSVRDHENSIHVTHQLQEMSREQYQAGPSADEKMSNNNSQEELKVMALNDTPMLEASGRARISSLPDTRQESVSTHVGAPTVVNDVGNDLVKMDPQIDSQEYVNLYQRNSATPPPAIEISPFPMRRSLASSRFGQRDVLKGIRILLAEDTLVLQKVATLMLEKMGATVIPVTDGLQAVNALTVSLDNEATDVDRPSRVLKYSNPTFLPFDLVLMDCQMPKMDGYDATRAIREAELGTNCHIPIVALTAHAMSSDEAKCLEVGMDAYLTKPIDQKLMLSTIISLTKGKRLPSENSQAQ